MSLKIMYIIPHLGKGGAEELIVSLAKGLSKGNKVTILLFYKIFESNFNIDRLPPEVEVIYLFKNSFRYLSSFKKVIQFIYYFLSPFLSIWFYFKIRIYSYDVVHINLTLPSLYLIYFKTLKFIFKNKEFYVQTFHSNLHLLKGGSKLINTLSWHFCDSFVYEIYQEEIEKLKPLVSENKIEYIPFGFCKENVREKKIPENYLQINFDITKNTKVFMTISRVRFFEKKIDIMIESMKLYKQYDDNFVFMICGDGEDMTLAKELVNSYGLSNNVLFLGYVDDPEFLSKLADVFIVAVVGNSTGISGMQAISNQIPVIGVQTVPGFISTSDSSLKQSVSAKGVSEILIELDLERNLLNYKKNIAKIAAFNCEKQNNFSSAYLSLYKTASYCNRRRL